MSQEHPAASSPGSRLPHRRPTPAAQTFAALRHSNYRLWFVGQMTSLFGTWMQATAQSYLVYQLTRSPAFLGYVGFASGVPIWLFMLYGGVISDRVPRRTLLIVTQTCMMALAFALAALTFAHVVRPWHILVLAFGLGLANAFDAPARQAFVSELVAREDLSNAIALNAILFNAATAIGPAAAGLTYQWFGPGWCFTLNGISFIAVIAALLAMRLPPKPVVPRGVSFVADVREAFGYLASQRTVMAIIALVGMMSGFGIALLTLIPAWAVTILHGDATTNGLLQSARGVGALLTAFFIAWVSRFAVKGRLLTAGTLLFPTFALLFAFTRSLPPALAVLALLGASVILVNNLANALVQSIVPDAMRGRVMGVYTLTFFGLMPIGALWVGALAERIGEPPTVIACALVWFAVAAGAWTFVPGLRRLA